MKFLLLCLLFLIFLSISRQETCQYSFPSIIKIDDFSSAPKNYWFCDIYNGTDTNFIRDAIRNCTTCEYSHKTDLYFYRFTDGPVSIELDFGPSITNIRFSYISYPDAVQVSSLKIHSSVTVMNFNIPEVVVPQSNFFELFPNLESVYSHSNTNLSFSSVPTFNNLNLTRLTVTIQIENGFVLNRNFTQGLDSLQTLFLTNSGITSVSSDSFTGMTDLVSLSLANNFISYLPPRVFEGLSNLITINLDGNQITAASPDSFHGLNSLTYLTVAMNIDFPVHSLRDLKSLRALDIESNGYTGLDPFPFQQLNLLTYLRISNNPFECGCELQWLSMVTMYDVTVQGGVCVSPVGSSVSSVSTYSNCSSVEFSCLNKSIACPSNQVCQNGMPTHYCCCPQNYRMTNTGDCVAVPHCYNSYQTIYDTLNGCGCGIGYTLSSNCSVCVDINECGVDNGNCEQECVNTIGSYTCSCNHGYRLVNLTFCEDINECENTELGCRGYCENAVGSYNCRCWNGYQQINSSSCSDFNECAVDNGDCEQLCYNTEGSYFCGCYRGYNYTMDNLKFCHLETQTPEALNSDWSNPTMVIAAACVIVVLFILLTCQTIVCVVVVCWKKRGHLDEAIELKPSVRENLSSYNNAENNNNNNKLATDNTAYVDMHSKYYTLNGNSNSKKDSYVESTHYEPTPIADTLDRGTGPIVYGQIESGQYENMCYDN